MKTIERTPNKRYIKKISHLEVGMIFCFTIVGFTNLYAQNNKDSEKPVYEHFTPYPDSMRVYAYVDTLPKFRGNVKKYFADSIRYPEKAKEKKIQGTVYLGVIIERDGSISNVKVLRSPDTTLSIEAKRVVSTMPKWTPGKKNGIPVRVQDIIPIHFILPKKIKNDK